MDIDFNEKISVSDIVKGNYKLKKTSNTCPIRLIHGVMSEIGVSKGDDFLKLLGDFTVYAQETFFGQMAKAGLTVDEDKFSIALSPKNDTLLIRYDGVVFEANHSATGELFFATVDAGDERAGYYNALLNKVREHVEKAKLLRSEKKNPFRPPEKKEYVN